MYLRGRPVEIFFEEYDRLGRRGPAPVMLISFYPYVRVNNTIRLRDASLHVRLSDALENAPESVIRAIAHILLAKLYRKPVDRSASARFRQYIGSAAVARQAERAHRARGRKQLYGSRGSVYDLQEIFDAVNLRFFYGLMAPPTLTWSAHAARRILGHYDSAHNTIVVSRVFDRPHVPRAVIEYLMYHEMLHLKHPVRMKGSRRCVHSPAFQQDENLFPDLADIKRQLKTI